jgi:FMN reductase
VASVNEEISVVGISGSLRPGSLTSFAVQVALKGAKQAGARVRFLDLRDYGLNLLNEASEPPGLKAWREDISTADGMILGTPEYHGSFSGVLKNALDYLGFDQTEGKMIGLVGVSAGALGAFDAMNGLRSVGRALHAWVVPQQAAIPEAWKVFDGQGNIVDPNLERRLIEVGSQVARFAHLHKRGQIKDFLADWEKAPVNPGGETGI